MSKKTINPDASKVSQDTPGHSSAPQYSFSAADLESVTAYALDLADLIRVVGNLLVDEETRPTDEALLRFMETANTLSQLVCQQIKRVGQTGGAK